LFLLVIFLVCAEDLSFFTPKFLIIGTSAPGARSVSSTSGLVFRCQRFSSSLIISVAHGCYSPGTPASRRGLGSCAKRRPGPTRPCSRFQPCDDSTALTRFALPMLCCLVQSCSWMSMTADSFLLAICCYPGPAPFSRFSPPPACFSSCAPVHIQVTESLAFFCARGERHSSPAHAFPQRC
jgi:hypothetical protein